MSDLTTTREALALFISKHRRGSEVAWAEDVRLADAILAAGIAPIPSSSTYCVHCAGPCEHPDATLND